MNYNKVFNRDDYFQFGLVFIKKNNQIEFKKKTETKPKPVQTSLARFFSGCVFGLDSVRFGFFGFRLIKPKLNRTGRFFQNSNRFNRFFFTVWFFQLFFFSIFSVYSVFRFFCSPLFLGICTSLLALLGCNKAFICLHWELK